MERYAKVQSSIWTKSKKFRELDIFQRYVYLYLLTCQHGNSAGLYRMVPAYCSHDCKMSLEEFDRAIKELCKHSLISFDRETETLYIHQYMKFNPVTNEKHAKGTAKAAAEHIESSVYKVWAKDSKPYFKSYHSAIYRPIDSDPIQQNTDDREQNTDNRTQEDLIFFWQDQCIHPVNSVTVESIVHWYNDIGYDLVKEAMTLAAKKGTTDFRYVEGIMKRFDESGIKNLEDLEIAKKNYEAKKQSEPVVKKNSFHNHQQHEYDFDALEQQMDELLDERLSDM